MRRRCGKLRRRYGCFRLPKIPGAKAIENKRKDVTWLARTDPKGKTVEFSHHWDALPAEAKRYITLHERAHLKTGVDHNAAFYEELKRLVKKHRVSWETAYDLEAANCHKSH